MRLPLNGVLNVVKNGVLRQNKDRPLTREDLIAKESKIGAAIFGAAPAGVTREFFCYDVQTWVWRDSYIDTQGQLQSLTTRYELRGDQVMKVQNSVYKQLSVREKAHLKKAIEMYYQRVVGGLYAQNTQTL